MATLFFSDCWNPGLPMFRVTPGDMEVGTVAPESVPNGYLMMSPCRSFFSALFSVTHSTLGSVHTLVWPVTFSPTEGNLNYSSCTHRVKKHKAQIHAEVIHYSALGI